MPLLSFLVLAQGGWRGSQNAPPNSKRSFLDSSKKSKRQLWTHAAASLFAMHVGSATMTYLKSWNQETYDSYHSCPKQGSYQVLRLMAEPYFQTHQMPALHRRGIKLGDPWQDPVQKKNCFQLDALAFLPRFPAQKLCCSLVKTDEYLAT